MECICCVLFILFVLFMVLFILEKTKCRSLKQRVEYLEGILKVNNINTTPAVKANINRAPSVNEATVSERTVNKPTVNEATVNKPMVTRPATQPVSGQANRPVEIVNTNAVKPEVSGKTSQLLFAVGVLFVFVAGIIFMTSTWKVFSGISKVFMLAVATAVFSGFGVFAERKLEIRETSVASFVLGSIISALVVGAIAYFKVLGEWFSFKGDGRSMVIALSFLVISLMLFAGYKLYTARGIKLAAYILFLVAMFFVVNQCFSFGADTLMVYSILYSLIFTGLFIFEKYKYDEEKRAQYSILNGVGIVNIVFVFLCGIVALFLFDYIFSAIIFAVLIYLIYATAEFADKKWLYIIIPIYALLTCIYLSLFISDLELSVDVSRLVFAVLTGACFVVFGFVSDYEYSRFNNDADKPWIARFMLADYVFPLALLYIELSGRFKLDIGGNWKEQGSFSDFAGILIATIFIIGAYVYRMVKVKNGCNPFRKIHLLMLAVSGFFGIYGLAFSFKCSGGKLMDTDTYLLIAYRNMDALLLMLIAYIILYVSYYRERNRVINGKSCCTLTAQTFSIVELFVHASMILLLVELYNSAKNNLPLELLLCIVAAALYVLAYFNRNNKYEFVTMLAFVVGIINVINIVYDKLGFINDRFPSITYETKQFLVIALLASGYFCFKQFCYRDRENRVFLIDWNVCGAVAIFIINCYDSYSCAFRVMVTLSIILLYLSYKLSEGFRLILKVFAAAAISIAYMCQDVIAVNPVCSREIAALGIVLFSALLYFVIFRNNKKMIAPICFVLLIVYYGACYVFAITSHGKTAVIKLMCFAFVMIITFIYGKISKIEKYEFLAAGMLTVLCIGLLWVDSSALAMVAIILAGLYIAYLYNSGLIALVGVPLLSGLIVLCAYLTREKFVKCFGTIFDNALLFYFGWIVTFVLMMFVGRLLHKGIIEITENRTGIRTRIDYFALLAIVPFIAACRYAFLVYEDNGVRTFLWVMGIVLSLYFANLYKRIGPVADRVLLCVIAVLVTVCWWTQPVFDIADEFVDEWRIFGLVGLMLFICKSVFKDRREASELLLFITAIVSVLWQGFSALADEGIASVIILGIALVIMLVVSLYFKSKRWYLLSLISLCCLGLYMTKRFLGNGIWFVFVFVVGVFLIVLAARREYRNKKNNEDESDNLE